jgi:uncharacterized protein DUF6984
MSDASPVRKLGPLRDLRADELAIIKKMLAASPFEAKLAPQVSAMKVQEMPDGGMGSIKFFNGRPRSELEYGKEIAEAAFKDADGVPVSLSLRVDKAGDLFELDVWKVDFSPLIGYPDPEDLEIVERHGQLGFPPQKS